MDNKQASRPTQRDLSDRALARRAYSINETGNILNISRSTTYAALKSGLLDSTTIGRKRLVTAESVDRLLARASSMDTGL